MFFREALYQTDVSKDLELAANHCASLPRGLNLILDRYLGGITNPSWEALAQCGYKRLLGSDFFLFPGLQLHSHYKSPAFVSHR